MKISKVAFFKKKPKVQFLADKAGHPNQVQFLSFNVKNWLKQMGMLDPQFKVDWTSVFN